MKPAIKLSVAIAIFTVFVAVNGGYIPPGPLYRCPSEKLLLHPCFCDHESDVGISVRCENTNLASMSVGLNNLATFQLPIERLTIYKCHFARLFGSLLYKLKLRLLYIIDTPLEVIDEHSFLGVNETLNELHISNSTLKEFPANAFKILGNLTILNIDIHQVQSLAKDAFFDSHISGKLLRFHLTNGNLSLLPIETMQHLRKLKTLDLHGNQIKELKRNQFKGLRDTEVLDLSHNNIAKVDGSHLADLTKLGWLNISHNAIGELTRGAFARNSVLKVLNMSHNKIKKLDSNSFRGMRFLRRLYLSDNSISDVGRGTFAAVTRIGTIDLARNSIKKVDYQMYFQLNFVEIIDMAENNITEIQKLSFKDIYYCKINISHNQLEKIEVGSFENCANITLLDLSHNKIKIIPKRAFDETSYALELQLSYNNLTDLSQVPLHNMTGLKILNVSHNAIEKIPKGTFPKLYELHTIDLSYNNLTDIHNAVLQPLFSLRLLNMSHNSMVTIKPGTFGTLPTLLELDLSYNLLKDVARSSLTRLASTRKLTLKGNQLSTLFMLPISVGHLDLSNNEFEKIPPKLWPSMNSLLSLDLSENMLTDGLEKGSFESLLTLQRLNLNNNGITKPPWEALSDLASIQYLYFENNNLTKLEKGAFGRLPVVFELNLANNNIHNITAKAFDGLIQLITLNLTNNNITYIPNGALQGMVTLQKLDLSFNKIEKIDNKTNGLLDDCLSLEKIDLSHNRISFITRKTFPSNRYIPYKLRDIDLSYNSMPVITFDLTFGTSKVEKLNLSHNAIADIRKGIIGNITNLKVLDLSHNKLENLVEDLDVFKIPKNVTELYLSNNLISTLPWANLDNVTRLDVLDVRNNLFSGFGPELMKLLSGETTIYFSGNPLYCDCFVRPLRRYFSELVKLPKSLQEISCHSPPYISDKYLFELDDDRLNCPSNVNTTRIQEAQGSNFGITTDLKIRGATRDKNILKLKWRVLKNDDIADTYVVVRDKNHPELISYETILPYFLRKFEYDLSSTTKSLKEAPKSNATKEKLELQICLLSKDSKTFTRRFYADQCQNVEDANFANSVKSKYFVIFIAIATYLMNCI